MVANLTPNFGLSKPTPEEFYDVAVQNGNMDIIDEKLKEAMESSGGTPEEIGAFGYIGNVESGANLNDLLTTGSYRCTGADASTVKNSPIADLAFHLHVFKAAGEESTSESTRPTIQIVTTTSTTYTNLYWRKHASGTWTEWKELANVEDLPTQFSVIGKSRIDIPASSDLNDYITVGSFRCTSNSNTVTLTNCPTAKAFTMDVVSGTGWHTTVTADNGFVVQKILDHQGKQWTRIVYASGGSIVYGEWEQIITGETLKTQIKNLLTGGEISMVKSVQRQVKAVKTDGNKAVTISFTISTINPDKAIVLIDWTSRAGVGWRLESLTENTVNLYNSYASGSYDNYVSIQVIEYY